jgi:CubicO group peptidase (beta-lactamase class C family)
LPEEIEPRLAVIVPPAPISNPDIQAMMDQLMGPDTLLGRVMNQPDYLFAYDQRWNTRPYHAAELPSSNAIGSARALAKIYAACVGEVDGIRLLDEATVGAACAVQTAGTDAVLGVPTRFGLGFSLSTTVSLSAPATAFGHAGAGGSLGFAGLTNKIGFGYAMNRWLLTDFSRARALVQAVYQAQAE